MKTWPLRWRIAIWSALVSALALLTFTAVVAVNLYAEQVEMIDVRLSATAPLVAAGGTSEFDPKPLIEQMKPTRQSIAVQITLHGFGWRAP